MFFWFPTGGPQERIAFIVPFDVDFSAFVPSEPLALVPIAFASLLGVILAKARQATRRHAATIARASKEKDSRSLPDAA